MASKTATEIVMQMRNVMMPNLWADQVTNQFFKQLVMDSFLAGETEVDDMGESFTDLFLSPELAATLRLLNATIVLMGDGQYKVRWMLPPGIASSSATAAYYDLGRDSITERPVHKGRFDLQVAGIIEKIGRELREKQK